MDLSNDFFSERNEVSTGTSNQVLIDNFTRHGWSPVRIRCPSTKNQPGFDDTDSRLLLHQSPFEWKEQLVKLFVNPQSYENTPGVTYRHAESGKPGTIEPKESLEVQRSVVPKDEKRDFTSSTEGKLLAFADLLHQVACTVRRTLGIPQNVLLLDDSTASDSSTNRPVDLLRVFNYETVDPACSTLGSSEHTDWGSFTVVWQDSVGGLQTYCHACQKWVDVKATMPQEPETWDFVVHVGDLTSICVGSILEQRKGISLTNTADATPGTVVWPSPRHRVVSPKEQRRLSLVYFAYPPMNASLKTMQERLKEWCLKTLKATPSVRVPWDDYFILRNQSSSNQDKGDDDPQSMYQRIERSPIKNVLEEKWSQVQR